LRLSKGQLLQPIHHRCSLDAVCRRGSTGTPFAGAGGGIGCSSRVRRQLWYRSRCKVWLLQQAMTIMMLSRCGERRLQLWRRQCTTQMLWPLEVAQRYHVRDSSGVQAAAAAVASHGTVTSQPAHASKRCQLTCRPAESREHAALLGRRHRSVSIVLHQALISDLG
jgi:hypothetical protein